MKRYSSRWLRLMNKNKLFGNNAYFIRNNIEYIDYKNTTLLNNFLNRHGQIIPSIFNKLTLKYQRHLANAVKRARQMALIPYLIVNQNERTIYSQKRYSQPNQLQDRESSKN